MGCLRFVHKPDADKKDNRRDKGGGDREPPAILLALRAVPERDGISHPRRESATTRRGRRAAVSCRPYQNPLAKPAMNPTWFMTTNLPRCFGGATSLRG